MSKVIVADVHNKLLRAGIPVVSVKLLANDALLAELDNATDQQKKDADLIIKQYDQDAEDAARLEASKPPAYIPPITFEDVTAAKSIPDIKALLIKAFDLKE